MKTIQDPSIYEALDYIARYFPDNFTEESKAEVETLLDHCLEGYEGDSEKFLSTLFIRALKKHINGISFDEHIYLKKFEAPQIELFNILIRKFPFIKLSHQITNSVIFDFIKDKKEAIFVDIGIGQGVQTIKLLEMLKSAKNLQDFYIVGIEVIPEALKAAEAQIMKISRELPFNVRFVGLHALIENFDFTALNHLFSQFDGDIIIHESLTLHHIKNLNDRNKVIQRIKALRPALFLMTEPNVDHYEPDFYRRFHNCFKHFHHVFQVIDNLEIEPADKNSLKLFFGREIEDIIGGANEDRYEKHEPAFRWIEKLKNNGFKIKNPFAEYDDRKMDGLKVHFEKEGYLGFTYGAETVLAIICAEG